MFGIWIWIQYMHTSKQKKHRNYIFFAFYIQVVLYPSGNNDNDASKIGGIITAE